jgi:hypothetical protein
MSSSVEVTCGACGASLGDQYRPGDAIALLKAHIPACPYAGQKQSETS